MVTDLSMPGMSGRALAREIRTRDPALPVVLLTGDTDAQAEGSDVSAVVKKPFQLDALEAVVQQAVGEREPAGQLTKRNTTTSDATPAITAVVVANTPSARGPIHPLAETFGAAAISGPDALHLATAMLARVDVFCTTDDRLVRRSARVNTEAVSIVTPLQLAALLDSP